MAIELTDAAAERVRTFLEKEGGKIFRFGIRKSGCSGWAYTVGLDQQADENDAVFVDKGISIAVDRDNLAFLDGTQIDFIREGLNHVFSFKNPNVTDECGCGESFSVKKASTG